MKANLLLIADADTESFELTLAVARQSGYEVLRAHSTAEAFKILDVGLSDVAAVVIDVCPRMHGMVVLTDLEESYMRPIAVSHGAAACLGKPLTEERLATVIAQLAGARRCRPATCDLWGHPGISSSASRGAAEAELAPSQGEE